MTLRVFSAVLLLSSSLAAAAESDLTTTISLEVSAPQRHSVSGSVANIYIGNHSVRTEPRIRISCAALNSRKQVIETKNAIANNIFPGQVAYSNIRFDAPSDKIESFSCSASGE